MSDYDNTNSGAIFKNDKKESDKHPDYKGSINADGKDFWASVWINESKAGQKYFSIKLTAKDGQTTQAQNNYSAPNTLDDSEDIPF